MERIWDLARQRVAVMEKRDLPESNKTVKRLCRDDIRSLTHELQIAAELQWPNSAPLPTKRRRRSTPGRHR